MKPARAGIIAFIVVLVAVVAFAASTPDDVVPASSGASEPALDFEPLLPSVAAAGIDAPEWAIGDTWSIMFPGGEVPCVLTVVDVTGDQYLQASACPEGEILALQDAVYDLPHLGATSKSLAGVTASGNVEFFSWPLTDGKTWETEWGGIPLTITATFTEKVRGPDGAEPGYRLVATSEGQHALDYSYVPSIGWWSELDFDGDVFGYADVEVVAFERSFEGVAWSSTGRNVYRYTGSVAPVGAQLFSIPDETDVVAFRAAASGGDYVASIVVQDPQRAEGFQQSSGFFQQYVFSPAAFVEYLEGEPGQWSFTVDGVGVAELLYEFIAIDLVEWDL